MEPTDPLMQKRSILDYWTLVEFFSPYILDNFLDDSKSYYQRVFADKPDTFPWSEQEPLAEDDPASTYDRGYHLYLGLFSTEETADRARHVFSEQPSTWQSIDWRQCGSATTISCFARLTVTKFGSPLLGTLTLSTLPWAHGRLLNKEEPSLTMEFYWKGVQRLLVEIRKRFADSLPKRVVRKPSVCASILDHEALCKLAEHLFSWANFAPKYYPIAVIKPLNDDETSKLIREPEFESEKDVPILNSFYIQELERAATSINPQERKPLALYLSRNNEQRILLEEKQGQTAILEALKPCNIPKGRWPAPASQQQSLRQQFAVNQVLSSLKEGGLFSVNGPPGTGKTTLLREIVANNMVERANALAQFQRAKDALTKKRAIGFGDKDPVYVSELHPSLLGYEMLVVSSNNTAVQNLSQQLPIRQQLDTPYENASYLQSVACKLLGLETKKVWGLISAALGNRKNCRHLVDKIFISRDEEEGGKRIWDWVEDYNGPSFADARDQFLSLQKKHESLIQELDSLAQLHEEIAGGKLEATYQSILQELEEAKKEVSEIKKQLTCFQNEEEEAQELLDLLEKRLQLWKKERPSIVNRLVQGKDWNTWSTQTSEYTQQQIAAVEELHTHKDCIRKLRKKLKDLHIIIEAKELELLECGDLVNERKEIYKKLKYAYPDVQLPEEPAELDTPEIQKQPYYQNSALNNNRSELFLAAMTLHEAWLAETLQTRGGFRGNLLAMSQLLQGKNPTTADDTRLCWQSVFLLIPLLSSTFASVGRLFRYLEPQSLGWVFIDEAGQALPQAAVGAIWRAKRVLSIGDPFQIEPISTVPPEIVDGMAKQRLKDHCLSWAPSQISVQNLMDEAAQYVSKRQMREITFWLGAPLQVHRRCIEPMFSISNEIAYENSMVLATETNRSCLLPQSCWYDEKGSVADRQYVPNQGAELICRLKEALTILSLPDLYIISPFREVVQKIQSLILRDKDLKKLFETRFTKVSLHSWVREAVGTVHSFQGKQATAVFFVLGADKTTLGSIEWATRKPNLLNVAVTRACQRFYIIGDYNLWRRWPYFDVAAQKLKKISMRHYP